MPRPPKKPSEQDMQEIEALAGIGLTQEQVADLKGMCVDTLRKYCQALWKRGKSKAIAKVAKTAFDLAGSGKHPCMTRFYLRTQAGWCEKYTIPDELMKLLKEQNHED